VHRYISRIVVLSMPPELILFYKKNIDFIAEHSVDPDKKSYVFYDERSKHYFDYEYFSDSIKSKSLEDIIDIYSNDSLIKYGYSLWNIPILYKNLTKAFVNKEKDKILKITSDLSHYVGDINMPLHATVFYDGKYPFQKGIHNLIEKDIALSVIKETNFFIDTPSYINNIKNYILQTITNSYHSSLIVYFKFEKTLNEIPSGKAIHTIENSTIKISPYFEKKYSKKINNIIKKQLIQSVINIRDIIYSAWIDAGKPDMSNL